jgi:murein DD-endopeptidase MepM/ murein hydrolase activator NlpD
MQNLVQAQERAGNRHTLPPAHGECASTHPRRGRRGARLRRARARAARSRVDRCAAGRAEGQWPLQRRHRRHPGAGDGERGPALPAPTWPRRRRLRGTPDAPRARAPRPSAARIARALEGLAGLGCRGPAVPARQAGLPVGIDRRRPRRADRSRAASLPGVGGAARGRRRGPRDAAGAEPPVSAVAAPARAAGLGPGRRSLPLPRLAPARRPRLPGASGTAVLAPRSATVAQVGYDGAGWGSFVVLQHGSGVRTLFAHLSSTAVRRGQAIAPGRLVGRVGSTGGSTGPHLHFEVFVRGANVDPLRAIR